MNLDELNESYFKGFLAKNEAVRLYELAREAAQRGPCLEIGSYCGYSAAYLGSGCKAVGGVLFSIDHHRGSEEQQFGQAHFDPDLVDPETGRIDTLPLFRSTLEALSLQDTVIPIISRSEIVARFWRTPLSLLFIDGGHSFESAFSDYSGWISNLLNGGYLIIHDVFFDPSQGGQAPRCIYQMALSSGSFGELPMTGTLGVLRRFGDSPWTSTSTRNKCDSRS